MLRLERRSAQELFPVLVLHRRTGRPDQLGGLPRERWSMLRFERRSAQELYPPLLVLHQRKSRPDHRGGLPGEGWQMLRIQRRSAQELFRSKADSDSARQTNADENGIDWHT